MRMAAIILSTIAVRVLACLVCLVAAADVRAQGLPSEPISVANGRFVVGLEAFATIGSDDPGFFNYTDYEYNALRNFRVSMSTELRASSRMQVLAEIRFDHGDTLTPYALFLRIRPWPARRFDVQVGRVPPTFGAFNRTIYAYDNLVIGQPLAYQYLLSLQPTAIPGTADDLVRMRGRGWFSTFPVGDPTPSPGLPIVNTARYDTGIQLHGVSGAVEWTGAVTAGSLSDPLVGDNNGLPQFAGRLIARPTAALRLGLSAARGAWLDDAVDDSLPEGLSVDRSWQTALGADAEVSRGRWLARAEVLRSSWALPAVGVPEIDGPLVATSLIVEGRYRLWPGLSVAARSDNLWFSRIQATEGPSDWEADTYRVEVATTVAITRNVMVKVAAQHNRREGGRQRTDTPLAAQIVYWF
jgi:hypothetical protein